MSDLTDDERLRIFSRTIHDAIAEGMRRAEYPGGGGMVNSFVLVATYHDMEKGDLRTIISTQDNAHLTGTLGLVDFARVVFQQEARDWAEGSSIDD